MVFSIEAEGEVGRVAGVGEEGVGTEGELDAEGFSVAVMVDGPDERGGKL